MTRNSARLIAGSIAFLTTSAHAAEQVCWNLSPPVVSCDGADNQGHGEVYDAPPPHVLLPAKISSAFVGYAGDAPAGGSISVTLDPGGDYIACSGYPQSQLCQSGDYTAAISRLTPLAAVLAKIGHKQNDRWLWSPPVYWRVGDKLLTNYACTPGGASTLQAAITICFAID